MICRSAVCRSFSGNVVLVSLKGSFCVRPVSKQWVIVAPDILEIVIGSSQNTEEKKKPFVVYKGKYLSLRPDKDLKCLVFKHVV